MLFGGGMVCADRQKEQRKSVIELLQQAAKARGTGDTDAAAADGVEGADRAERSKQQRRGFEALGKWGRVY